MISLQNILAELHAKEFLRWGLKQLYDKYRDHPQKDKIYINFSKPFKRLNYNYEDPGQQKGPTDQTTKHEEPITTMSKKAIDNPEHHDPVGIYAYQLNYVLDRIRGGRDVPFAGDRPYIRVLVDKSKHKVIVNDLKEKDVLLLFVKARMKKHEIDNWKITQRQFNKKWGEVFFSAVQHKTIKEFGGIRLAYRTSQEQTAVLRKMGIDCLEDQGEGIIYQGEPAQALFLTRDSFEIIDVLEQSTKRGLSRGKSSRQKEKPSGVQTIFNKIVNKVIVPNCVINKRTPKVVYFDDFFRIGFKQLNEIEISFIPSEEIKKEFEKQISLALGNSEKNPMNVDVYDSLVPEIDITIDFFSFGERLRSKLSLPTFSPDTILLDDPKQTEEDVEEELKKEIGYLKKRRYLNIVVVDRFNQRVIPKGIDQMYIKKDEVIKWSTEYIKKAVKAWGKVEG